MEDTKCRDKRKCFAKTRDGYCCILQQTYEKDGQCPFCKEYIDDKAVRKEKRNGTIEQKERSGY